MSSLGEWNFFYRVLIQKKGGSRIRIEVNERHEQWMMIDAIDPLGDQTEQCNLIPGANISLLNEWTNIG